MSQKKQPEDREPRKSDVHQNVEIEVWEELANEPMPRVSIEKTEPTYGPKTQPTDSEKLLRFAKQLLVVLALIYGIVTTAVAMIRPEFIIIVWSATVLGITNVVSGIAGYYFGNYYFGKR